ncbi:MAG: zinc-binding alcohol dehydrogenase family protein [Alicyclobacillus macrosporangiidus]|uniref:zinc-binding alcohol dehydrogenase family protein n=1 Tax=Alicyclobacillus macrosporangiidus TaxID=392015 RepID=UPI0026F201ED|nr:zinc-binding alcohol dehydrogenase family protein [Alicyclobacillus macrosporangiidus]MCL6600354.1 zinc-binding alcohol dehydrogenase family protein [Alicyclobacillus macrosporangiidus]
MKRVVCEEPYRLVRDEAPEPAAREDCAFVHIRRVGVCGTDLHAYRGEQPYFTYPRVLGHELSGEIVRVGPNTQGLRAGDRVLVIPYTACGGCVACRRGRPNCCVNLQYYGVHVDGGMCEYMAIPVDHLIPANDVSLDDAAMVECLSIGMHAVNRASVGPQDTVLVVGAGPIGLGVMRLAKLTGANVIAMDTNERRNAFAAKWAGVDATVMAQDHPLEELFRLTGGDLPTVVVDATGNARSMMDCFQYVCHGGTVVYVSLVKDVITFYDPDFQKKETTLLSSRGAVRAEFERVLEYIRAGQVDIASFITHRLTLDEVPESFEALLRPDSGVIKAIVEIP